MQDRSRQIRETPRRMAEREWLRGFTRWARGDPNLSAWEESFLASIARLADTPGGPLPSAKQAAVLFDLIDRLGYAEDRPVVVPEEIEALDGDSDAVEAA